jgi:phage tail-like protein
MSFADVVQALRNPSEPEVNFNFLVFVGAMPFGCFKSISEFAYSTPKKEFAEGGRLRSHEMAFDASKGASWGNVTLKWGNSRLSTLQAWSQAVRVGGHFRREVFIFQLDRAWEPTRIFHLHGAWPVKWTADGFDGDSGTTPWTVTGVELSFKTMHMVLTGLNGLNLLRAGGLSIPALRAVTVPGLGDLASELGFGDLVPDVPPELDYIPVPNVDAAGTDYDTYIPMIKTQNTARLDELIEDIKALDAKVTALKASVTQSGALNKPVDELSDAEFAAVLEYKNAVGAKADAEAEKAGLEAGGGT